jgi:hypothetical protein
VTAVHIWQAAAIELARDRKEGLTFVSILEITGNNSFDRIYRIYKIGANPVNPVNPVYFR